MCENKFRGCFGVRVFGVGVFGVEFCVGSECGWCVNKRFLMWAESWACVG